LSGEKVTSRIRVGSSADSEEIRLRQLLEKLDLGLEGSGKPGLGSENLLFMACELLLLGQQDIGNRLLLIEEPEAHLHAQRQLQLMKYVQDQAKAGGIQVLVTTHSANLSSVISLDNLVMLRKGRAFPMGRGHTKLQTSDYRFLERFLDVTKANLFFASGVLIVEGDSENILLPTLAKLIGRDFSEHGVSIVNVGGTGLHRYARIFQRQSPEKEGALDIPVACLTDMDVMPDCGPEIIGLLKDSDAWPEKKGRRWLARRDFENAESLCAYRDQKAGKASGQSVKTFVSDEWTLEYDLAFGRRDGKEGVSGGIPEDVFVAACLAEEHEPLCSGKRTVEDVVTEAVEQFAVINASVQSCANAIEIREKLACQVYSKFVKDRVSKAVAAQYLAERLMSRCGSGKIAVEAFRALLPKYLVGAIDYVTGGTHAEKYGGGGVH